MKHLLKKFGFQRLIVAAITAISSVGMWGCSDQVEFKWSDGRGTPLIAGFIDDSLVVAYDCREWLETTETWSIGDGYSEESSCGHDRLLVYNYRVQEDGPRWTDSLTNKRGGYRWYQLTDSIFWRWEGKNILLWKIGETAHEMKLSRKNEGCSHSSKIERMHQWLDGTFIALGGDLSAGEDSCQYAVLDTAARTLTFKRLDKNLEWIKKCDDVRAWGDDVYCLALNRESYDAFLIINEFIRDTMMRDDFKLGNYAIVSFLGNYISLHRTLCKYENNSVKRLTSYSSQGISFGDGKGNYITYGN
jgi:hypothetical protein